MSKERPIPFKGPMIRAILESRKTQTRRVLKHPEYYGCPTGDCPHSTQHECDQAMNDPSVIVDSPYGVPGDRLWVRETWQRSCDGKVLYKADDNKPEDVARKMWKPSIHMPRSISRITLEVTGVRVERLQDISESDAKLEGVHDIDGERIDSERWIKASYLSLDGRSARFGHSYLQRHRAAFWDLWESINGEGSWDANPWVWVVEFKRIAQAVSA